MNFAHTDTQKRPVSPAGFSNGLSRYACTLVFCTLIIPLVACATKNEPQPAVLVAKTGTLPDSGRVSLRSGMQWLNEQSPTFQKLSASLGQACSERGLTVVAISPSQVAPLPSHLERARATVAPGSAQTVTTAAQGKRFKAKTGVLTLAPYVIPENDADLPASVLQVRPPDLQEMRFALSQLRGEPILTRVGPIPGRIPVEMRENDPTVADYSLVCRFATVIERRPLTSGASPLMLAATDQAPEQFVTGAAPMQGGVGRLGYGAPAAPAPPRPPYGGGPTDFTKGYEGSGAGPGDPWNREADLKARDFQMRYGPQPQFASPPGETGNDPGRPPASLPTLPKPPLPGDNMAPPVNAPSTGPRPDAQSPSGGGSVGSEGPKTRDQTHEYALEMDCYDLAPARRGQAPSLVWQATVRQRTDSVRLSLAFADMVLAVTQPEDKRAFVSTTPN